MKEKETKNINSFTELLISGIKEFGIKLNENQISELYLYKDLMKEWNQKVNLTAIEDEKEIVIKHFIDSLSILPYIENKPLRIIDVGTGAGFPGIPIKIAYNNTKVHMLDSLKKRVDFLNLVIDDLKLVGIEALHGRAEDAGCLTEHRETYDISVSRAVSSLPVLIEYCLPFLKVGGMFIAMKGSSVKEEINSAKRALRELGGVIEDIKEITLPFTDMKRTIILIKKVQKTLIKYPRKAGTPTKEPL